MIAHSEGGVLDGRKEGGLERQANLKCGLDYRTNQGQQYNGGVGLSERQARHVEVVVHLMFTHSNQSRME